MLLLKILFLPFYIAFLPFKWIFGGSSSKSGSSDYEMEVFLDDCEYFEHRHH